MIYKGNLILRTMVFEYLNNSLYFKGYLHFLEKKHFSTMVQRYLKTKCTKTAIKIFLGRVSRIKYQVLLM